MKTLLAIAISGMLLTGCSKSVDPKTKSFIYPLALGNQWTYAYLVTMDYVDARKTDTLISSAISATVERVDTILPGIFSYTIRELPVGAAPPDPIPEVTYLNLPDGMYRHYSMTGSSLALPKRTAQWPGVLIGDCRFPDTRTMVRAITDPLDLISGVQSGTADPLPLILPYPQRAGQRWTYRDRTSEGQFRIDKEIEGEETITTPAGTFECHRIRWIYGPPMGGVDLVEFISAKGLIRRRMEARVLVVDYQHPYGIEGDTADVVTTFDLTSVELH